MDLLGIDCKGTRVAYPILQPLHAHNQRRCTKVGVKNSLRTLLLDIGGVAVVDTAVANHLIKIARAAVLMGCRTIISGISPAIAQTVAELGIDLGAIQTTSTIEAALRQSIARSGS